MRVLFVGPNLAAGGAQRQLSILVPALRERGIDARVIALDGGGPFEEPLRRGGVPLDVISMRHQADLRRLLRSELVHRFVPDVVVSRSVSGLYVGHALARLRHAVHIHADHRGAGLRLTGRREAMTRLIARRVDRIIAVSNDQAGTWVARGVPSDRIVVVANGVAAPRVAESAFEIRRDLGIPDSAVLALLVATLRSEKDVPVFVRAVLRARETHGELIGLIAGEGPDRPAVEAALRGDPAVRLLGQRDDVPRLLKAADLFVLASRCEALPMALLEAMAAGLPVLATRVGGIPDVVADGVSGLLVAPGDEQGMARGLAQLAGNRDLRTRMGEYGAKRHREHWTADAMIEGYTRVLDESCASARAPHRPCSSSVLAAPREASILQTMAFPGGPPEALDRRLRVGVMLDSLNVHAWVARILEQLASAEFIELANVILTAEEQLPNSWLGRLRAPRRRHLLFNLYQRIDARLFRAEPDAFAEVDMSASLASVPTLEVVPLCSTPFEHRFAAHAVDKIREADLDVILRFGFRTVRGEILDCARSGVWGYHHGDSGEYRGAPAFFWEMYENNPVSGTMLQILTDELDGGRALYRSFSATDPTSLYRSRNAAYWKSAEFVLRRLTDLHRHGPEYLDALPESREPVPYAKAIYRLPTNRQMIRFLARRAWGVAVRKVRKLLVREIWYVAYQPTSRDGDLFSDVLSGRGISRSKRWRLMSSPQGRYYADPFVVEDHGRHYVFFEDYDLVTRKAVISWACFDDHGTPTPAQIAVQRDYHLSYPFVFRWNGNWYMAPETAENGTIELFRAEEFPTRWEFDRILIADIRAFDPTIFEHDGRWWLLANAAVPGGTIADELFLFYADSPHGEWTAHPMNPIVSDVRRARPAGRPFSHDGMLIRPAQDSSRRYGYATVFNRVTVLTTTQYAETPIRRLGPGWMRGNLATHTFNTDGEYQVLDALRRVARRHDIRPQTPP